MEHQVAGHIGNIISNGGTVIKLQTHQELDFYSQTVSVPSLVGVIPKYHGEATIEGKPGIELEDLTSGFDKPCIMDLKLGAILYGADASPEKRKRMEEQALETTSGATGLRICGMRCYNGSEYDSYDKSYGRSLTSSTLIQGFELYLSKDKNNNLPFIIEKAEFILAQVRKSNFKAGGCSLLILYDFAKQKSDVRLIDFAHAEITAAPDSDLISALHSLLSFLYRVASK
jgi:inositol-hexakisphosphate 5-kinase